MSEQIKLSALFSAEPKQIYDAWLDSKGHTAMTGEKSIVSKKVGGNFTAGSNYMHGKNLELVPNKRIIQSWRSKDFHKEDLDSLLLIKLEAVGNGTKLTLVHSEIPDGQSRSYKDGWEEFYFAPMKKYFKKK